MSPEIDKIELSEKVSGESNWLEVVRRQVESLRYGVVQIVVHDSLVTQIDKTERVRLDKPATPTKRQTKK